MTGVVGGTLLPEAMRVVSVQVDSDLVEFWGGACTAEAVIMHVFAEAAHLACLSVLVADFTYSVDVHDRHEEYDCIVIDHNMVLKPAPTMQHFHHQIQSHRHPSKLSRMMSSIHK